MCDSPRESDDVAETRYARFSLAKKGAFVMTRTRLVLALVAALLVLPSAAPAVKCLDDAGDAAQIADARTAVDGACKCFGFDTRDKYVSCARGVVKARADALLLRKECKGTVTKIYPN